MPTPMKPPLASRRRGQALPALLPDCRPDRRRNRLPPTAGAGHRRPARRRSDRAVHRPLPQGSDRRPRRHPVAPARRAPELPARTGGPARRPRLDRRAGQTDARAGGRDRRRRHQAAPRRSLPALQAEAAQQGADRPRGRPRAARRSPARRPDAVAAEVEAERYLNAEAGFADLKACSTAPARS
jgi:hypothetical protein